VPAPHVLIAGAGIGGLTAAIALARRGIAVTLAEKRTGFAEVGAGIQISPNAGHVLERLDLRLQLKRAGVSVSNLVVRNWRDGRQIAGMPMGIDENGTPFRTIRRADLHMLLLDAARTLPNIRLVMGRGLDEIATHDDGVTATLVSANGHRDDVRALAVIGADGVWSRVRELSIDVAPATFTGYEAWRTLVPAKSAAPEVSLHLGSGRHAVHYPVAGGRETNLVIMRKAAEAREGWSREGDGKLLDAHLAGASPALRALAAAAPGWQVWSLFDRAPAVMAKGRIALLGDAAHPVLPFMAQGAAMAIEDAAILARLLAQHLQESGLGGVTSALARYAQARAERVARVQATSRANARTYHMGWPLRIGRDLVMRRLGPDGMRRRFDWLYDWRDGD
jgi:salicylate hydroxylase